jgi:hypothetical protein
MSLVDPLDRGIPCFKEANSQATNFIEELEVHHTRARDALVRAQSKQAAAYDKYRRTEEFEEGDKVLMNPHSLELIDVKGTGRKLVQRCIGPFWITERINPVIHHLAIPWEYKMHPIINIQHLQCYHCSEHESRAMLPELRELRKEEEYEVE